MHARVKLVPVSDDEVFLEIPENLLECVGMREGELVEITPFIRTSDGAIVERTIMIRKVRQ